MMEVTIMAQCLDWGLGLRSDQGFQARYLKGLVLVPAVVHPSRNGLHGAVGRVGQSGMKQ